MNILRDLSLLAALFLTHCFLAQNIQIDQGSGSFFILGGEGHTKDTLIVHYHKPANFKANSKVLMVIPGAGRNSDDYRDSWVETSERYGVLVISPSYPEEAYDYAAYHLGGVVKNLDLRKGVTYVEGTNQVRIDEDIVQFEVNAASEQWLYNDFDTIFDMVKEATKSVATTYDMFGHSAGGQILHRFVLLKPDSKANRILASNGGTYTFPDFETNYPFGLKNVGIEKNQLDESFKKELVLFLGELDNENETGGRMLRSVTADKQGTHRFERGNNFYTYASTLAAFNQQTFNWKLETVPGVGHNQAAMAAAAAVYLYQ